MLVLAARIAVAGLRLSRALGCITISRDPHLRSLFDDCRARLGIARSVELCLSPGLCPPALVGWRHPRILLPGEICANLSPDELCLVLLHELGHLKRRDIGLNWLLAALQCMHWFNPLIWLAFARLRVDRELACDELVLTAAAPSQSNLYGRMLIKLLETLPKSAGRSRAIPSGGGVGILERAHRSMRRRILMVSQFTHHRSHVRTLVGAVMLIALAGFGLTDRVRAQARPAGADRPKPGATRPSAVAPGDVTITAQRITFDPSGTTALSSPPYGDIAIERQATIPRLSVEATRTHQATTQPLNDAEALYRQFERRIPEMKFDSLGFADTIDFLRDKTDLNMIVNSRALEAAGIDMNTTVNLKLRDVTLEQALRQILEQVGGGTVKLGFGVQGNAIVISTTEAVPARSRVYDVADLLGSATTQPAGGNRTAAMAQMIQIIEKNVAPESWRDAGGSLATITPFDTRLVITTTDMNHLEIDRLLAALRSNAR